MSNPWPAPPDYYDTPSKGYKVILQTPGFPVIYPEPSVSQVCEYHMHVMMHSSVLKSKACVAVSNMRPGHWSFVAGMAGTGYVLGYWKGAYGRWMSLHIMRLNLVVNLMRAGSGIHWQKPACIFGTLFMGQFGMGAMMQDCACESLLRGQWLVKLVPVV